ncbi:MAG: excinuclease ABC subunit UvrA [Candidatus Nanoarchaeia archaeon]|nr:excinuclease ABC subunit UvrA [Candidatus Nanoarchaeia archaeon]
MDKIVIIGAKENNLKNINLEIPRDKLVVFTGVSGSGKSTLAFDTIYAEGQRRYVESLSAYARQFLGIMNKPDVEKISGLSPAISIDQKTTNNNPRSTVGTVTEIYDYLRLLYARVGKAYCPIHKIRIQSQSIETIINKIKESEKNEVLILSPIIRQRKGSFEQQFKDLNKDGFSRVRVDGKIFKTLDKITLDKNKKHDVEIIIDSVNIEEESRLNESIELALKKSEGLVIIKGEKEEIFSSKLSCHLCDYSLPELEPRMFSFNSPFGACPDCKGLGVKMEFDPLLIIPDKSISIIDGAVKLYRNLVDGWRAKYLENVAKSFGFNVFTPIKDLSKEQFNALMYGSDKVIKFKMTMGADSEWSRNGTWEGLIPQSDRLFNQTNSEYRKEELKKFMKILPCPVCKGERLKEDVLNVLIDNKSINYVSNLAIDEAIKFFKELKFNESDSMIAENILKEINSRLEFLNEVGLSYISLSRSAGTLSGGESQRIRLATQIGSNLTGVLYVLDEPSIGLHQRDNDKLIKTLCDLRDLGNTLIVVEHDEDTIRKADYLVDIGPGAGIHGGKVVACGTVNDLINAPNSITGKYLSGELKIEVPSVRRISKEFLEIKNANKNNLKNVNAKIPLGILTAVTGVSGSGKSSLIYECLHEGLINESEDIINKNLIDKTIIIDQSPIGRTPRSNPATYIKVFDTIRELFSKTKSAKEKGYKLGRFSFNVFGGRCENCQGDGVIKIEMNFLPDVYVPCEECKGKRYNKETLKIKFKDKNISEVLDMSVSEALEFFKDIPNINRKIEVLEKVGLGYIKLGQSSTTLSGGESQRIKLTRELGKRTIGKTLYLLDEPTTGLHFDDVKKLIMVLNELVNKGNTIVVIEHNLDVIKSADYVIDLGPEGGDKGGEIIAIGTPEEVSKNTKSYTAKYLKKML